MLHFACGKSGYNTEAGPWHALTARMLTLTSSIRASIIQFGRLDYQVLGLIGV